MKTSSNDPLLPVPDTEGPWFQPASLVAVSTKLRSGAIDLKDYIEETLARTELLEPRLHALLPERLRRERLLQEASQLAASFPDPVYRPSLYGVLVGVKDIFSADRFETRGGSALPSHLFAGPEAVAVHRLRAAGALVLGKTVTTEFAGREPAATVNPHNSGYTPGGSSSGSAVAVASGYAPLAIGSQTAGSVIRPASYCGVVGVKPTYDRIPPDGMLLISRSVDHVGFFVADAPSAVLAASILCSDWCATETQASSLPTLAILEGPYLAQAEVQSRAAFEDQVSRLSRGGVQVRRVPDSADLMGLAARARPLVSSEFYDVHTAWFDEYGSLYGGRSAMMFETGRRSTVAEREDGKAAIGELRHRLHNLMEREFIELWASPATVTGAAPRGLGDTGDPAMNSLWTFAGLPTATLPFGSSAEGLPLGLQLTAGFMRDERLLAWSATLEARMRRLEGAGR